MPLQSVSILTARGRPVTVISTRSGAGTLAERYRERQHGVIVIDGCHATVQLGEW